MKILIAADGSAHTKRMLAYLAAHDEWLGARHQYTVVTVVTPVPPHAASMVGHDVCHGYYRDEAEKVFEPIRAFFSQQGIPAEFTMKVGPQAELIAETAQQGHFDLLMMGSHGHGTLVGLALGSVTTKTLARCTVPVLIVR